MPFEACAGGGPPKRIRGGTGARPEQMRRDHPASSASTFLSIDAPRAGLLVMPMRLGVSKRPLKHALRSVGGRDEYFPIQSEVVYFKMCRRDIYKYISWYYFFR